MLVLALIHGIGWAFGILGLEEITALSSFFQSLPLAVDNFSLPLPF